MKLMNMFVRFGKDEDGAVTVDWVVLTAGIVAVAIVIAGFLSSSLNDITGDITSALGDYQPFAEAPAAEE